MDNKQAAKELPFPEELTQLAKVRALVAEALSEAEDAVHRHRRDYHEFMEYIAAHRGEIDPKEIFQSEQLLQQEGFAGVFALQNRDSLARLLGSPYFARIDFEGEDSRDNGIYYVGRSTFRHNDELHVLDWRAPVASMFYDYELGPAGYETPQGKVAGTLCRKRQFKISDGEMEYALESSLAIRDDVLQKELSSTSDEKMRSIIATIQKEQNRIIRDEVSKVLIIQGVAGSGKTSIALHRIAYLLYRFKGKLSADNVVILSPNKVFSDHISNVLPELGERPVYQMGFRQLADIQLEGILGFYPETDPLENEDGALASRTRFKSTAAFLQKMDDYIEYTAATIFTPGDYTYGPFTATKEWIWERYEAYGRYPIKRRVAEIADDILDRFTSRNIQEDPLPKMREILKALNGMLRIRTTRALYREMFRWMGKPGSLVMKGGSVEWADVYPFLYLQGAFEGLRENHRIRHVVVDEMQDYTPVQFAVLKKLFACDMTILGDFSQSVDPCKTHTVDDLCALYPAAKLMLLEKSYRSTCEIIDFAGKIRPDVRLKAVNRHGAPVRVLGCESPAGQLAEIRRLVQAFQRGDGANLGIITKQHSSARALYETLPAETKANLVEPDSEHFSAGVSVLCVGMSKGLEFDEVILVDTDDAQYTEEHDKNLLYVACTRAMHRLTLLYHGAKSRLLP